MEPNLMIEPLLNLLPLLLIAGIGIDVLDAQKIINEWLSKAHINMKTNLSQNQVNSIPENILKMRLAKGEITPEKYTELMSRL
jgi:uncharacterized membrane protein